MKDLRQLNSYRDMELQRNIGAEHIRRSLYGNFLIPLNDTETALVIADNGLGDPEWEHVSASLKNRCLTWEEMCIIKELFFHENETVIQIHPAKKDYVNNHPYCLHLWRSKTKVLPLSPSNIV